ncbi:MAG: anthranilate synthase component I family protein [Planctomycetes bacterium]|nr:anthranilate synthase component I family protein [Planctomycetota bacterium]
MPAPIFSFQPRVEPLVTSAAPALGELTLVELAARLAPRALVLLDGWPRGTSVLAFDPLPARPPRSLAGLRRFHARLEPGVGDPVPGGFHGGFLGALSYELGAAAERGLRLPRDPWALAPIVGGLFTDFLVRDEARGETFLVLGERPGDGRAGVSRRARALRKALLAPAELEPCRPCGPLRRLVPRAAYRRRIERVRALIAAGEVYQVNLSHRLERALAGEPFELYRRLRALHPAPYAAYLRGASCALLSASPELLLEFGPEPVARALARPVLRARTRPIKGTAPRGADEGADRAQATALLASAKDRAELAMIVDLERNDLGRIAAPGGVWVEGFPSLESYASVHHLVADVLARPRPEIDALACLAALYPGGSITGAPKLRSMEVIAALEREGRGFAYGSLLALDTRGVATASLLIRTLIWRPRAQVGPGAGEVSYRVGGGITWGSEPAAEEAEAEAKGLLLARALAGAAESG